AAVFRHDGTRWWLKRREECSVPVQVGSRSLARNEEAPLTHGLFVLVGGMRATFVDRRYMTPTVPAGAVDPSTGLLGRPGIEQETAAFMERRQKGGLVVVRAPRTFGADTASPSDQQWGLRPDRPGSAPIPPVSSSRDGRKEVPSAKAAMLLHKLDPQ